jgi:hypothetical protein
MSDQEIQNVIEQIWSIYDIDNSGALDKKETKKLMMDTLGRLPHDQLYSEDVFSKTFTSLDKNGSGTIEKREMLPFVR